MILSQPKTIKIIERGLLWGYFMSKKGELNIFGGKKESKKVGENGPI